MLGSYGEGEGGLVGLGGDGRGEAGSTCPCSTQPPLSDQVTSLAPRPVPPSTSAVQNGGVSSQGWKEVGRGTWEGEQLRSPL